MKELSSSTYVKSVEVKRNQYGGAAFCRVELATGHSMTVHPEDAPKAGDQVDVLVRFTDQPALVELDRG